MTVISEAERRRYFRNRSAGYLLSIVACYFLIREDVGVGRLSCKWRDER